MTQDWMADLRERLGPAVVLDDVQTLHSHSYDSWPVAVKWKNQRKQPHRPEVVVRPQEVSQVCTVLTWANQRNLPITPWGAGSGVTGAALSVQGGICLDLSALNQTLLLDETNLLVKVQAGKMGHHLEAELNEQGYTLNHSPQSLNRSTAGGWVATRATGQFSSRWGSIEDLVAALTVVLPTGELVQTKLAPRAAIGPDLRHLFIGAEGITGVVVEVTLKIFPLAEHRIYETLAFNSVDAGVAAMRRIMRAGLRPFLVRFYDEVEAKHAMQNSDFEECVMFLAFEGLPAVAEAEYNAGLDLCRAEGGKVLGPEPVLAWMDRRFDFSTVENLLASPGGVAETIEVAHFWDDILDTYKSLRKALEPLADEVLAHFSHVYPQGTSLYMILLGQAEDDAAAEARLMQIWETAMEVSLKQEAAISHHHGIGLARHAYVRADLGSSAIVLDRVKEALDPNGIMNPEKMGFGG